MSKRNIFISCSCLVLFIGLSIFFLSASAESKSVSQSFGYYDLNSSSYINSFEGTDNINMFNGSNSHGYYYSMFSPDKNNNLGYGQFNFYGYDLELVPANYDYNSVNLSFVTSLSWTQVSDIFREDNFCNITFGLTDTEYYITHKINQVSDLALQPVSLSVRIDLSKFQDVGFGIRGFYVRIDMPNHSSQVIMYNCQLSWEYSTFIAPPITLPPLPTVSLSPLVTPPPVPTLRIEDLLNTALPDIPTLPPSFLDKVYRGSLLIKPLTEHFFSGSKFNLDFGGVVSFALLVGTAGTILGYTITYLKNRGKDE